MKVYSVFYEFKDEDVQFTSNMDDHPTIKWLTVDGNPKAIDCEEDDDGVEFYFKHKKDAVLFAHQFLIPVKNITRIDSFDNTNPWLPEGCSSIEECMEIYGDVPGFR